jgi:hypothetical protein
MFALVLLSACPQTVSSLFGSDPLSPPPEEPVVEGNDTGTAFVVWHGSFVWDPAADTLEATRGYGAMLSTDRSFICDIWASFESVGVGPVGCPDCTWSFQTRVTGGGTEGDYCDAFLQQTVFDDFGYQDFYFGRELDGFGFTRAYDYSYGSTVYALEDVVWAHIDATRYNGWYLYGYNLSGAVTGVEGDEYAATFLRYAAGQNGRRAYYYFWY